MQNPCAEHIIFSFPENIISRFDVAVNDVVKEFAEKLFQRLAIYEICYFPNVPDVVAANEAVELSKKYAEKKDSGFINAIIGSFIKDKSNNE